MSGLLLNCKAYANSVRSPSETQEDLTVLKLEQNVGMFQRTFETFRYNAAGLTDQYLQAELTGTDTSCLTTTQVERWVDWRYRYNAGGTREQKREYAGTEPDTLDAYYEWTYYLLGAGGEQRAVWKGAQTKQPDTCGTTGEHVYMWATEYLVYGALGLEIITKDSLGTEVKEVRFTDHLGSTRATYSTTGGRTGTDYKPFGSVLWNINGNTARTFIGQESDEEMDLGDFGARKYDASIGRFTAIDPLFEMYPSFTPYNYCNNNPINYIDPSGLAMLADQEAIKQAAKVYEESSCPNTKDHNCGMHHLGELGSDEAESGGGGQSMVNATEVGTYRSGMGNSPDPSTVQQSNSMPHEQQGGVKPNSSGGNTAPGNTSGTTASQTNGGTPMVNMNKDGNHIPITSWAASRWGWVANQNTQRGILPLAGKEDYIARVLDLGEFGYKDFTKQINEMANLWNTPTGGHYAPEIAKYLINTIVNFSVVEMIRPDNTGGLTLTGTPNISINIKVYQGKYREPFPGVVLHEIVHAMGGSEFHAFAAQVAAGYLSESDYLDRIFTKDKALSNDALYVTKGMPTDFMNSYFGDFDHYYRGQLKVDKHTFFLAIRKFGMAIITTGKIVK